MRARGSCHGSSKLTEPQVVLITCLLLAGRHTQTAIAQRFGVSQSLISQIGRGKAWKFLGQSA